jgi:hypothetical protein
MVVLMFLTSMFTNVGFLTPEVTEVKADYNPLPQTLRLWRYSQSGAGSPAFMGDDGMAVTCLDADADPPVYRGRSVTFDKSKLVTIEDFVNNISGLTAAQKQTHIKMMKKIFYYGYGGPGQLDKMGLRITAGWNVQLPSNGNWVNTNTTNVSGDNAAYHRTHYYSSNYFESFYPNGDRTHFNDPNYTYNQFIADIRNLPDAPAGFTLYILPQWAAVAGPETDPDHNPPGRLQNMAFWQMNYGDIKLTKNDNMGNPLAGCEFGLYGTLNDANNNTNRLDVKTTDSNGVITFKDVQALDSGTTYYIKELSAPANYLKSTTVYSVTVRPSNTSANPALVNNGNAIVNTLAGKVKIVKTSSNPACSNNNPNYSLQGATFELYTDAAMSVPLKDVNGNNVVLVTNANGEVTSGNIAIVNNMKVWVKETVAPKGFELSSNINNPYTLTAGLNTINISNRPANDPVIIKIEKDMESTPSGNNWINQTLVGTKFLIKYYPYDINSPLPEGAVSNGQWIITSKLVANTVVLAIFDNTAEVVEQFVDGLGQARDFPSGMSFPVGFMSIEEIEASPGYALTNNYTVTSEEGQVVNCTDIMVFTLDGSDNGLVTYQQQLLDPTGLNNQNEVIKNTYQLHKLDADTLSGLPQGDIESFMGTYYTLTSNNTLDVTIVFQDGTEVTLSENESVDILINNNNFSQTFVVPYGTYTIVEKTAIEGYELNTTPMTLNVTTEEAQTVTLDMTDELSTPQNTVLTKVVSGGYDVPVNVTYEIINRSVNSVIYNGTEYAKNDSMGLFYADVDGVLEIALPIGTYEVIEQQGPNGLIIAKSFLVVAPDAQDVINYVVLANVVDTEGNKIGSINVSFTDEDGKQKDSWVSTTNGDYIVKHLLAETTYTMLVTDAIGYITPESVDFTVSGNKNDVVDLELTPLKVGILNVDSKSNALVGGEFELLDGDVVVHTWTGTLDLENVGHLLTTKQYTIRQTKAPEGYYLGEDKTISILATGVQQTFTFRNDPILQTFTIAKLDADTTDGATQGNIMSFGGTIFRLNNNNDRDIEVKIGQITYNVSAYGNVDIAIDNTNMSDEITAPYGDYILEEIIPAEGYSLDATLHTFTVDANTPKVITREITNEVEKYNVIIKKTVCNPDNLELDLAAEFEIVNNSTNSVVYNGAEYAPQEIIGSVTTDSFFGEVSVLLPTGSYIFLEVPNPTNGLIISDWTYVDITEDTTVEIHNTIATLTVEDMEGNLLSGWDIEISDANGIVDSFTSSDSIYLIKNLKANTNYTISSSTLPNGYLAVEDVTFRSTRDACMHIIVLVQKLDVDVIDTDNKDKMLAGGTLQLFDAEGTLLYTWDSQSDVSENISSLVGVGQSYFVRQATAPFGYNLAEEIEFSIEATTDLQTFVIINTPKQLIVNVDNFDKNNVSKQLYGGRFALYYEDGTTVKDINGENCEAVVDDTGILVFEVDFEQGDEFYVQQIEAPKGYVLNEDRHLLAVPYTYGFDEAIEITVYNFAVPATGDNINILPYLFVSVSSLTGIVYMIKRKKEQEEA